MIMRGITQRGNTIPRFVQPRRRLWTGGLTMKLFDGAPAFAADVTFEHFARFFARCYYSPAI